MAGTQDMVVDFIQDTFRPLVGVLCSEEAERHCQKNNLSFVKLMEPFCILPEGSIRDLNSLGHAVKNFKIVCHDLNEPSVSKFASKKKLNDIISNSYTLGQNIYNQQRPNHLSYLGIPLDHGSVSQQTNQSPKRKLDNSLKTPWYESYRKYFLESLPYSDHEYQRHYVSCIIAVSTSEPNPLDQLNKMVQSLQPSHHPSMVQSNASSSTLLHDAKWFIPSFLRFFVLVHDASEQDDMKAEAVYQGVKEKYGSQSCHLLHINSKNPVAAHGGQLHGKRDDGAIRDNPWLKQAALHGNELTTFSDLREKDGLQEPDSSPSCHFTATEHPLVDHPLMVTLQHHDADDGPPPSSSSSSTATGNLPGKFMTSSDVDRIRVFVREFILHSLLPWAEKSLKTLNEQASARKGIKGSLFSASKWFGRAKPIGQNVNSSSVVYSADSPEMQLRRLGDLSFLFQLYELAYQTFHTIKKDFNNDGAWMHFAGALEMACLSVHLQGASSSTRQYPFHYMETAIKTYYNSSRSVNFAARATMLSTEILKSKGLYAEAATQFMTVTSEDSDLLSALFLEQTAHCFLNLKSQMVRKYAFHMVLAGHRFNKAGQKKHVLRCYAQALEVFMDKEWSLAEDHIYLTIGSQAYNIRELSLATLAFLHLLSPHSKQSANQQAAFFAQYLNIYKQQISLSSLDRAEKRLEFLPLPVVDYKSIKVTCQHNFLASRPSEDGTIIASGMPLDESDYEIDSPFSRLEERLVAATNRDPSSMNFFKPSILCHSQWTDNSSNISAVVGEPITIEMTLENPLRITLTLLDVHPLWRFSPSFETSPSEDACFISNEPSFIERATPDQLGCVQFQTIPEFFIEGSESKKLRISLTCKTLGTVRVSGLAFRLTTRLLSNVGNGTPDTGSTAGSCLSGTVSGSSSFVSVGGSTTGDPENVVVLSNGLLPQAHSVSNISAIPSILPTTYSVPGMVRLEVRGKRLNAKEEKMDVKYLPDNRLQIDALPVKIKLEMFLCNFPSSMLCGEVVECRLEFVNGGQQRVTSLLLTSNQMEMLSFHDVDASSAHYKKGIVRISLPGKGLEPGDKISTSLRVKCPELSGDHKVHLLVRYAGSDEECRQICSKMKYRLIRHSACIKAESSLTITSRCFPSLVSRPDVEEDAREIQSDIDISLRVDNINMGFDFSVVKLLCVSDRWVLKVKDQAKDLSIKPGEYYLASLKAHKCVTREGTEEAVSCVSFSDTKFNHLDVYDNHDRVKCFLDECLSGTKRSHLSGTADARLFLFVIWKAQSIDGREPLSRYGRHVLSFSKLEEVVESVPVPKSPLSVPQIKFTSSQAATTAVESPVNREVLSQLVKTSLKFDTSVVHDFATQKSCIFTVEAVLLNCSTSDLFVSLEADTRISKFQDQNSDVQPGTNQTQSPPTALRSYLWIGHTKVSLRLPPEQSSSVLLKAKVFQPGVYDLSSIKTFVLLSKSEVSFNSEKGSDGTPSGSTWKGQQPDTPNPTGARLLLQKPLDLFLLTVTDARKVG